MAWDSWLKKIMLKSRNCLVFDLEVSMDSCHFTQFRLQPLSWERHSCSIYWVAGTVGTHRHRDAASSAIKKELIMFLFSVFCDSWPGTYSVQTDWPLTHRPACLCLCLQVLLGLLVCPTIPNPHFPKGNSETFHEGYFHLQTNISTMIIIFFWSEIFLDEPEWTNKFWTQSSEFSQQTHAIMPGVIPSLCGVIRKIQPLIIS